MSPARMSCPKANKPARGFNLYLPNRLLAAWPNFCAERPEGLGGFCTRNQNSLIVVCVWDTALGFSKFQNRHMPKPNFLTFFHP